MDLWEHFDKFCESGWCIMGVAMGVAPSIKDRHQAQIHVGIGEATESGKAPLGIGCSSDDF